MRRSGRLWLVMVLVLAMVAAGCAGSQGEQPPQLQPGAPDLEGNPAAGAPPADSEQDGAEVPPGGGGTEASPGGAHPPAEAAEGCTARSSELPSGRISHPWVEAEVSRGTCRATVHADPVLVIFTLPPEVGEEEARSGLIYRGSVEPEVGFFRYAEYATLHVQIPAGEPGERLEVRLAGAFAPEGSLGFLLERVQTPRVAAEVRIGDGDWQPVTPGMTLPREPLQFRFRLVGARGLGGIAARIRQMGLAPWSDIAMEGDVLIATFAAPPERLLFWLDGIEVEGGLRTLHSTFVVYTGQPPALVALDPASGQEEALGTAPVDALEADLSPDGEWAMLSVVPPDAPVGEEVWLVRTGTGEVIRTGLRYPWLRRVHAWLPDRLVVPIYGKVQTYLLKEGRAVVEPSAGTHWMTVSPDGRRVAGFSMDILREDPQTLLAPTTVVIRDLESGAEQVFPDVIQGRVPHSEVPPRVAMGWSESGDALLVEDLMPVEGGEKDSPFSYRSRWLRLDLTAGGEVREAAEAPPEPPSPEPLVRGPDGWAYQRRASWGEVVLTAPDGSEHGYGTGLILGWRTDGKLLLIRWENADHRREPMMM